MIFPWWVTFSLTPMALTGLDPLAPYGINAAAWCALWGVILTSSAVAAWLQGEPYDEPAPLDRFPGYVPIEGWWNG